MGRDFFGGLLFLFSSFVYHDLIQLPVIFVAKYKLNTKIIHKIPTRKPLKYGVEWVYL